MSFKTAVSNCIACFTLLMIGWSFDTPQPTLIRDPLPTEEMYGTGAWNSDSLGNHRAVLEVSDDADAVWAHIPWRRRDLQPEKKMVLVIDAATDQPVENAVWKRIDREAGDVIFQPVSGPGKYYVYYLLYRSRGSRNYPKGYYLERRESASGTWLGNHGLTPGAWHQTLDRFPKARVLQFQSIDEFNSFYPMEVIATAEETRNLVHQHEGKAYLLFPEDREYPIRMTLDLPARWIVEGPRGELRGKASRGEYYAFQIGLFAGGESVTVRSVTLSELRSGTGDLISPESFTCINTQGIDWKGRPFHTPRAVPLGSVQPLWMGLQIPGIAAPGIYEGTVTVDVSGHPAQNIRLILEVRESVLADAGDGEPWRHSRLRWLNSQFAMDDSLVEPFTPVRVEGSVVACLGRGLTLSTNGLPDQITSYFSPEIDALVPDGRALLSGPVRVVVEDGSGSIHAWKAGRFSMKKHTQGVAEWTAAGNAGVLAGDLLARMEFDGYVDFQLTFTATKDTDIRDIRLEVPLRNDIPKYMMGMGLKGGFRPVSFDWKWDVKKNHDALWLGDVNAGIQISFRDTNYSRPLNTNFYQLKPLNMPPSWWNDGKGGLRFRERDGTLLVTSYSGRRTIKTGETLHFFFSFLLTPFKLINTDAQWSTRYYHRFEPVRKIKDIGANTINVHHATDINPYINYPFLRPAEMKAYVDSAHHEGMKVKIYYTVRELSNRAPELFALRSLGDEILSDGAGGGFSWLQEHLDQSYIAAWFVPRLKDAAVINSGVSRWHNYYVEGLNWLVRNVGIDGLYIDDVAFDRTTMKRVRKVLNRARPGALIDLHSANQFNPRDGFVNSANLYLEHFPYIDRLWFGEYFEYDRSPDYWLVEVSGIPFGLLGEMLEKGGNPWRGMLYGMTSRLPWAGDPRPVWKMWDSFGMKRTRMFGYWSPSNPVRTDHDSVLATTYVKQGTALVSLASWSSEPVNCRLNIQWSVLGIDSSRAVIKAPFVQDFQSERDFDADDPVPVQPGKGWILIIAEK